MCTLECLEMSQYNLFSIGRKGHLDLLNFPTISPTKSFNGGPMTHKNPAAQEKSPINSSPIAPLASALLIVVIIDDVFIAGKNRK